ncbi:SAF domain-containing protein [Phytoactinopolyspora endophytica]|uniref:SAF domain-containing protein n=1 Tax=Phytoactinopolyspora endophytica TaxID=1642495 RepID=UPI00101BE555|nr:SAF domain-containing protein [Phytoactinopolyspora endophytica]
MMINNGVDTLSEGAVELDAPAASRVRQARWRNPQLIVGVLLVLVSTVVGVRVVSAAGDTVPVLAAAQDLAPGQPLTGDMVQTRQVALEGDHDRYYTGEVDEGDVVSREVRAGELLPKSAVVGADEVASGSDALRLVTVSVPTAELPAGLSSGDAVDVWVTPLSDGDAVRLAGGMTVTEADTGGALGVNGSNATVTLAARGHGGGDDDSEGDIDELVGELIAASRDGRIYLSQRP